MLLVKHETSTTQQQQHHAPNDGEILELVPFSDCLATVMSVRSKTSILTSLGIASLEICATLLHGCEDCTYASDAMRRFKGQRLNDAVESSKRK